MPRMALLVGAVLIAGSNYALAQDKDVERQKEIDKLVQNLGADDFKVREEAEAQLRKIGEPAIPALKKALEDADAERADRARRILQDLEKKEEEKKAPRVGMRVTHRDLSRGITFDLYPDGRVELTVPEEDKDTGKKVYRKYEAGSIDEFKEKYPEVAKLYDIDRFIPKIGMDPFEHPEVDDWLKEFRKRFDFGDFEKERRRMEELFRRLRRGELPEPGEEEPAPRPAEFGIRFEPVDETVAAQLDLKEGEGVQVTEVKPGSVAEKAGLQKHDVILKLNGEAILDRWEFRAGIRGLLGKEFEIEVFRAGKREIIKVK